MIVTLKFKVPEEQEELKAAQEGLALAAAMDDFDKYLRGELKYAELPDEDYAIYERIRKKFNEYRNEL